MELSQRASSIPLSTTLALDAKAKALAAAGRDIVNMSVGEPDFDAPAAAQDAACRTVRGGNVRYTPAAGTNALRAAVARHLTATRGVAFDAREVTICASTKQAVSGAVLAVSGPGDEVLLPLPAWVSYFEIVRIAGATPVAVAGRADCGPDLDALRAAITPRTRAVLFNTPSNPSGYVWSEDEVRELAELAQRHDLWLLSDEIYRRLVYEGAPNPSPVSLAPEIRARTVVLDGASKTYAMTGYRIGFAAAPEPLAGAIARLHSHLTGCPNTVSQEAYRAVLETEPPEVERMVAEFDARRRVLLDLLAAMGLETPPARGAFYAFPDVAPWLDERGSAGFCEDLLDAQGLAIVPGSAFGMDRHVRLSYALSMERIREAAERLSAFLAARPARAQPRA